MGVLKFWNGSAWTQSTDIRPNIWGGSTWAGANPKIYDGSGWLTTLGLQAPAYAQGVGLYSPGTAAVTFDPGGSIVGASTGSLTWIDSTAVNGSLYELYVTGTGLTSGTTDTWLRLDTSPTFYVTSDFAYVTLTCYIRRYGESGTPQAGIINLYAYGEYPGEDPY